MFKPHDAVLAKWFLGSGRYEWKYAYILKEIEPDCYEIKWHEIDATCSREASELKGIMLFVGEIEFDVYV